MKGPKIYILILALWVFGACAPARLATETQRDSTIVEIRDSVFLRDTIIQVAIPAEADKAILPDTDTSRLQTSLAESEAFVKDGRLHHTLRNRSEKLQPVRVQYVDRAHTEKTASLAQRQTIETVEVDRPITPWQRLRLRIGDAVLILAGAWAVTKLARLLL